MKRIWDYHNFQVDHRGKTNIFYCGQNVTKDGQTKLIEASVCLGEGQIKPEADWTEEEINALKSDVETNSFTEDYINQIFNSEPEEWEPSQLGLSYGNLSAVAIKAFQELSAKNDVLEEKVKALESA